jgi:hypothetical protein
MSDERTPLLHFPDSGGAGRSESLGNAYHQFCDLVGIAPVDLPPGQKFKHNSESLYYRATRHLTNQSATYMFTATLTNSLLLSQVVLGAALTALGASNSSRALITTFGALNTVIAGLIAFLKSRGQPMRARMFRDDLERVVDEIDNSAVMWLGISRNAHGYDAIDTDDEVTVRSEMARLTRLYDRAVKTNTLNDPDTYSGGAPGDPHTAALRARPGQPPAPAPAPPPAPVPGSSAQAPPPQLAASPATDPTDDSPATKPPEKPKDDEPAKTNGDGPAKPAGDDSAKASGKANGKANGKQPATDPTGDSTSMATGQPPPVATDPDQSPATAAEPPKAQDDTSKPEAGAEDGKKHSPDGNGDATGAGAKASGEGK